MKNVFLKLLLITAVVCVTDNIRATNVPEIYECDTLLYNGTFESIDIFRQNLETAFQTSVSRGENEDATLYALMLGETYKAMGLYKSAMDYSQNSADRFSVLLQSDTSAENKLRWRYQRAMALNNVASMSNRIMSNPEEVTELYLTAAREMSTWMDELMKSDTTLILLNEHFLQYIGFLLQCDICQLGLLSHEYYNAIELTDKAFEDLKAVYPQDMTAHREYVELMILKSNIYYKAQDFEQAIIYADKAMSACEQIYGKTNALYAEALCLKGSCYVDMNVLQEAYTMGILSQSIYETLGFVSHNGYADALELQGVALVSNGDGTPAAPLFEKAREVIKLACGEESFHAYLNRCFSVYPIMMQHKYQEAEKEMEEILSYKGFYGNMSGDHYLDALAFYYTIEGILGHTAEVIEWNQTHESNIKPLMDGAADAPKFRFFIEKGRAYQRLERYSEACEAFDKAQELARKMAHQNFAFLPEQQRTFFWLRDQSRFESILRQNITQKNDGMGEMGALLYNSSLFQKSLLLNAGVNMARVIEEKGPAELKEKMNRLRLMMQSELKTLEQKNVCRQLEIEVQNETRKYGDFMGYTDYKWEDVQAVLKDADVAIEFVCSAPPEAAAYSAEVLQKGMKRPYHVFLHKRGQNETDEELTENLCNAIKRKLIRFMQTGCNVYFAPAGELYKIPFEYMMLDNGKRFDELYNICRLSSTHEIITMQEDAVPKGDIALFGGLNYNTSVEDIELQAYAYDGARSITAGVSDVSTVLWPYLPGTMIEVTTIAPLMQQASYTTHLFTQDEGIEERFKELTESQTRIIHIATHGYFMNTKDDAMENSGLVFAGVNNLRTENKYAEKNNLNDGILTAAEIANLNLIGTNLVVMSACQTGLGNISGEGVFGLQRAFKKAGVQSLLMSLWEVDDEATCLLMTSFYKHLTQGFSKRSALRKAQEDVRSHTFERDGKQYSGNDPKYWAAFIIID